MSTNTAVEQVGTGKDEGVTLGISGGKASVYGVTPVVQAAAIATVTDTVVAVSDFNAVTAALKGFGIIA